MPCRRCWGQPRRSGAALGGQSPARGLQRGQRRGIRALRANGQRGLHQVCREVHRVLSTLIARLPDLARLGGETCACSEALGGQAASTRRTRSELSLPLLPRNASSASDFVTGTAIPVDGGYSIMGG